MLPFQKKDTIFTQGDSTDGLYFIQKGKVRLSVVSERGKEATLAILGERDFFGESGLAGQLLGLELAGPRFTGHDLALGRGDLVDMLERPEDPGADQRGQQVQVPLKEFELLEVLLRNVGRVLARMQLIDRVWGADYVGDTKTLDVHIKRLRAKIETDPGNPRHIITVRGLGYKFEPGD